MIPSSLPWAWASSKPYPESERNRVVLLFSNQTQRHFQWYAPEFKTIPLQRIPSTSALPGMTKDAIEVYTDDEQFPLPPTGTASS
jgi:hypothetical protein